MNSIKLIILSVLHISLVVWSMTGWAAPVVFTDQALFNTAVANAGISLTTDGFEDITSNVDLPLNRAGYTVTAENTSVIDQETGSRLINGAVSLSLGSLEDPLVFSSTTPTHAFSIILGELDFEIPQVPTLPLGDLTLAVDDRVPQSLGITSGFDLTLFIGVLDTVGPFNTVSIDRVLDAANDVYSFDLVQFEAPVPVPSTMLLFGTGLIALVGWRHWKVRHT
ncbi:MAG: PEP-CTERM sorting domain-containing protein [Nitrospirales bacterium]